MVGYTDITLLQPFLVRLGQMAGLTECETKVIAGVQFSIMHIRRGHNFIERGATPKYLFSILDGWVGRYNVRPDGSRRITGFMLPGEFSGIHALYHTPIDHTIVALTDCIILKLDATRVKDLIIRNPLIERALWRAKLIDEAILRTWLTNSSNAPRTLAHLLCELDFRQEAVQVSAPHDFKLPITQQNLADALGLTPVHVNRTLHALQLKELIKVRYGNVSLIDIETLRQFAFFDSTYLS